MEKLTGYIDKITIIPENGHLKVHTINETAIVDTVQLEDIQGEATAVTAIDQPVFTMENMKGTQCLIFQRKKDERRLYCSSNDEKFRKMAIEQNIVVSN